MSTRTETQAIAADLVRAHGRKAHAYARVTGESEAVQAAVLAHLRGLRNQVAA